MLLSQQPFDAPILVKRRSVRAGLGTHLFHRLQERVRHPRTRSRIANVISYFRSGIRHDEPLQLADLRNDGVIPMPGFLDKQQASQLYEALSIHLCRDPWKPEHGMFRLEDAPLGTHVADIPEAPTMQVVHRIAFHEELLALAKAYFGSTPYVDSIQAWWSLSGNELPEEAENFHRDNDGIRFLKFFLYLTDVDENSGPHKFVRSSHVQPELLARRRLGDEEVASAFGSDRILTMTGRAGDAFLEDTFGVHKGQLPVSGRRLLLQVRYSLTPTIFRSNLIVAGEQPCSKEQAISLIHEL
jgi:Phytanoyl-CoA dioxygenase (PhyH)